MLRTIGILQIVLLSSFFLSGTSVWARAKKTKVEVINYDDPNMALHTKQNPNELSAVVDLMIPRENITLPKKTVPDKILIPEDQVPEPQPAAVK